MSNLTFLYNGCINKNIHLCQPKQYYLSGGHMGRGHDCPGEMDVPDDACYGAQTQRAFHNLPISGIPVAHFPL